MPSTEMFRGSMKRPGSTVKIMKCQGKCPSCQTFPVRFFKPGHLGKIDRDIWPKRPGTFLKNQPQESPEPRIPSSVVSQTLSGKYFYLQYH